MVQKKLTVDTQLYAYINDFERGVGVGGGRHCWIDGHYRLTCPLEIHVLASDLRFQQDKIVRMDSDIS